MASDATGYDLGEIMARLAAMQSEAIILPGDGISQHGIDAVPYWPYQQEITPYFWNRINAMDSDEIAGDTTIDRYTIEMGLVCGHFTQGYRGELPAQVYSDWIPAVLKYFRAHRWLNTNEGIYKTRARWLFNGEQVEITGIPQGHRTVNNAGVETPQHYIGFILSVPLVANLY